MNSHTLSFYCYKILNSIANTNFCGIVDSKDLLKAYNSVKPCTWTSNVFAVNHNNEHWFVIIFKRGSLYTLDPLNVDIWHYNKSFADFVCKKYMHKYFEMNKRVQSLSSSLCGIFCLYFVYGFCVEGKTVGELENKLHNVSLNDSLVSRWFEEINEQ